MNSITNPTKKVNTFYIPKTFNYCSFKLSRYCYEHQNTNTHDSTLTAYKTQQTWNEYP